MRVMNNHYVCLYMYLISLAGVFDTMCWTQLQTKLIQEYIEHDPSFNMLDHFPIGYGPIPYLFGISLDGCIYYNAVQMHMPKLRSLTCNSPKKEAMPLSPLWT